MDCWEHTCLFGWIRGISISLYGYIYMDNPSRDIHIISLYGYPSGYIHIAIWISVLSPKSLISNWLKTPVLAYYHLIECYGKLWRQAATPAYGCLRGDNIHIITITTVSFVKKRANRAQPNLHVELHISFPPRSFTLHLETQQVHRYHLNNVATFDFKDSTFSLRSLLSSYLSRQRRYWL